MARGITQEQVDQAADAILGVGENPTVEKVRTELGTGSPNTITRMLDTWRSQLGNRLRQLSALPDVPASVGQVMMELWRLATEQAERTIEARFENARTLLEADQAQLTRDRESWEAQLQAAEFSAAQAQAARDLAEHACATLDRQLQDSHALRADLVQQRDRLQDQCDLQSAQNQKLRNQLDENQTALRVERERQDAYIRASEDRAHMEVDRARQDAKQWQQRHEAVERINRDAMVALQGRLDSALDLARHLEQEIARQTGQVSALEKALSESRSTSPAASKTPAKRGQRQKAPARPRAAKQVSQARRGKKP